MRLQVDLPMTIFAMFMFGISIFSVKIVTLAYQGAPAHQALAVITHYVITIDPIRLLTIKQELFQGLTLHRNKSGLIWRNEY